jgi:pyruvate kinase
LIPEILATDDLISMFEAVLTKANLAHDGDLVLLTAGIPSLSRGSTNMVKVHRIGSDPTRDLR